jgi:hypothetical protein
VKLEGSLDAFGLSDVFHLLQATQKTGGLWLRREGAEAVVHLDGGAISAATLDPQRMGLLRRLVMTGAVDEDAIADAATHAADNGIGLVAALQALDLVAGDELSRLARVMVIDVVFDLLRWPDGDFSFAAEDQPADDVGLRLSTTDAVADARARLERWESAALTVPSPSSVPSILERVDAPTPALAADQWSVLALIDGSRSVQEIVDLMGLGAFDVVTVVADLVDAGLVQVTPPGGEGPLQVRLRRLELMGLLDAAAAAADQPEAPIEAAPAPPPPAAAEPIETVPAPLPRTGVIPERPEPFHATRQPDHPEPSPVGASRARATLASRPDTTSVVGANAVAHDPRDEVHQAHALDDPDAQPLPLDEDADPLFNRSLVLRLIAGVRGL